MIRQALLMAFIAFATSAAAQSGLTDMSRSPGSVRTSVGMSDVRWTTGFWADRMDVCRKVMVPELWATYTSDTICYAFKNFKVAAGLDSGRFRGPSFHDGDFYKTIEALSAMYAVTRDAALDRKLDEAIAVIARAQKADGYIYTKNIIEQRKTGKEKMFDDLLSFEAYNFGHLMTAAAVHHRVTGKRNLLDIAVKAADFLIGFYAKATPELARNAICPSHYMGLAELYRATGHKRYITLLEHLFAIRGTVEGTDDNSDRAPFREMRRIAGHAVRANYLLAGAADLYAENRDTTLWSTILRLWDNVALTKMHVTGGCGALYDGVSVDGTSYKPDTVQKVHQSYGRDYQLPGLTAHNETCANIGNVLWNWRMFLITGASRYMDIVERCLYNSVLSGVSLDGHAYFYTNPLARNTAFPYHLRWEGGRVPYISKSNCCPPNVVRTIAEVGSYAYSLSEDGIQVNLYGANTIDTRLHDGSRLRIDQQTDYPWSGRITLKILEADGSKKTIALRIPDWSRTHKVSVNGKALTDGQLLNGYVYINRVWKNDDQITLELDMRVNLIESHPLVEETRNQVAVMRGPLVYCAESADQQDGGVFNVSVPVTADFKSVDLTLSGANIKALETIGRRTGSAWKGELYRPVQQTRQQVPLRLIPYFAWANRGMGDMSVWLPIDR